jgi:hypothetical protein
MVPIQVAEFHSSDDVLPRLESALWCVWRQARILVNQRPGISYSPS